MSIECTSLTDYYLARCLRRLATKYLYRLSGVGVAQNDGGSREAIVLAARPRSGTDQHLLRGCDYREETWVSHKPKISITWPNEKNDDGVVVARIRADGQRMALMEGDAVIWLFPDKEEQDIEAIYVQYLDTGFLADYDNTFNEHNALHYHWKVKVPLGPENSLQEARAVLRYNPGTGQLKEVKSDVLKFIVEEEWGG